MLAAYCAALGGDDPLRNLAVGEVAEQPLREGWARVRVGAASLNHHDLWTLAGVSSQPISPPQVLGCDAAGTVDSYPGSAVPEGAPAVGSRVVVHAVVPCAGCASCRSGDTGLCASPGILSEGSLGGTLAAHVDVPVANLVALPDSVGFEAAACLPTAYLTAYRMLFTRAQLAPGATVLVQGATGGVATAAILLGRAAGLVVLATSRDEERQRFAVELGARDAFGGGREATARVREHTGGRGVDAVIETVGEPTWDTSLRVLRPGGCVVVSGATGGADPPAQLRRVFARQLSVLGSSMGTRAELTRLVELCAGGVLRPVVDRIWSLPEVADAFALLAQGRQRGKLVVLPP